MGNIAGKIKDVLNKEKEKNTNLQTFIDELRSKMSEKEINLGAVNDKSKEKTDDKAIQCETCEKKSGNADQPDEIFLFKIFKTLSRSQFLTNFDEILT